MLPCPGPSKQYDGPPKHSCAWVPGHLLGERKISPFHPFHLQNAPRMFLSLGFFEIGSPQDGWLLYLSIYNAG